MIKVIKPDNVKDISEPVKIPDAVIIKKPKLKSFDEDFSKAKIDINGLDGDNAEKLEQYFSDKKRQMLEEVGREYEKISDDSKQLMEDSRRDAEQMIAQAREKAE